MKVILGTWAWIDKSELTWPQKAHIRDALTVYPRKVGDYPGDDPEPIYLYVETPDKIGVAREYFLTNRSRDHEIDLRVTDGTKQCDFDLEFAGKLREEQSAALHEVFALFKSGTFGGILRASPGWGKCQSLQTWLTLAETGERVKLGSLIGSEPLVPSLHADGKIAPAQASKVWHSGVKPCLRLVLASGQWLEASYDHPVLTQLGWKKLSELHPGRDVLVATARVAPEPLKPFVCTDSEVITAGLYLADGTGLGCGHGLYCKGNADLVSLFEHHVSQVPGFSGFGEKQFQRGAWYVRPLGVLPWIRALELDSGSKNKSIPGKLFGLPRRQLALLIRAVWTDGNLYLGKPRKLEIAFASEEMIDGLQEMLRRFGIVARKCFAPKSIKSADKTYDAWRLQIADKENLILFAERVGAPFGMEKDFEQLLLDLQSAETNTNWDVVPVGREELREIRQACKHLSAVKWKELTRGGGMRWMSRSRFEALLQETGYTGKYAEYASTDVVWEGIESVQDVGLKEVADLTVPETGNVVANGLVVHNTVFTCALIAQLQVPTLIVVHKEFLADQWEQRIKEFIPNARVGRVQGDQLDFAGKHIVIGMVHTLAAHDLPKSFTDWPGLVVTDECFPAGTLVHTPEGLVGIEDIREGDSVYSAAGEDFVEARSERTVDLADLVLVKFSGSEILCTRDHPFLTTTGWAVAANLTGTSVLTHAGCIDTMSCGYMRETGAVCREGKAPVRVVWGEAGQQETKQVLFSVLSAELVEPHTDLQIRKHLEAGSGVSPAASGDQASCVREDEGERPEERLVAALLRVESVAIPEPADLVRLGYVFEGDRVRVYNLTVRSHPSYVVGPGVVVHNCHRIGAPTWSVALPKFPARLRLGLTATPRRKDGADNVFWYHIGPILFDASEQRLRPKIRRVYTDFRVVKTASFNPALAPRTLLIRFLVASKPRNKSIAEQAVLALKADRKLLILSERLKHLDLLAQAIRSACLDADMRVPSFGKYVGGQNREELAEAAQAQVVLATSQYAKEGLDIPALDTLFLVTPMSDVEQAVGRILRPSAGKKEPIVVDFRDDHVPMFRKMSDYREATYVKLCR